MARRGSGEGWSLPGCEAVVGTGAVTFTSDDGQTLAPTVEKLQGIAYTYGLVALDEPNTLLAHHSRRVLRSEDAGCSWRPIGEASETLVLVAAPGGRAYGYDPNTDLLVRIEGEDIVALPASTSRILGLGVDPQDGDQLRVGDGKGQFWESKDGGQSFLAVGTVPFPVPDPLLYDFAFDPHNLDHVVVGAARVGAAVTDDGGRAWTPSTGLSSTGGPANAFSSAISPADSNVVWVQGLDIAEADGNAPGQGRHVYRSTDGGLTFVPVVTQSEDVTLVNGALIAAHPIDPGVLYFVFGTYFQDYGTDLYRYDARAGEVTKSHNTYDDVNAIAFSPADPALLYLGLSVEEISE